MMGEQAVAPARLVSRRAHHRRIWTPAPGFVETRPGVWQPEDYELGPWELPAPEVRTDEDAAVEYLRCRRSLAHFAFRHCWTIDVDHPEGPRWAKLPAYPYLRRLFAVAQEPRNLLIEKSRQMLISWAWMIVFLWDITFHEQWGNGLVSRRFDEVDDGGDHSTIDSLLGKLRHVWLALPPYLQAPLVFQRGIARDEESGSYVKAETGTSKARRGATYRRVLLDEAAYVERSEQVFQSLRQVAKEGLVMVSTPHGRRNAFARIRFSPTTTFAKLRCHWTEHPLRAEGLYCGTCGWRAREGAGEPRAQFLDHRCAQPEPRSPWYDRQVRDLLPAQVAAELDISYEGSVRGRVYDTFDPARHVVDLQRWVGPREETERVRDYRWRYLRAALEPGKPCVVGWDFGVSDPTALVLGQVLDEETATVRWLDEHVGRDASWVAYRNFVNEIWRPVVEARTGLALAHYGDPSGRGRDSSLASWVTNLGHGTDAERIVIVTGPRTGSVLAWLDTIRARIVGADRLEVSSWCGRLIDALNSYHFPTDPETGEPLPGPQLPVHDEASHLMDAMRYVYQFRWPWLLEPDAAGSTIRLDGEAFAGASWTGPLVGPSLRVWWAGDGTTGVGATVRVVRAPGHQLVVTDVARVETAPTAWQAAMSAAAAADGPATRIREVVVGSRRDRAEELARRQALPGRDYAVIERRGETVSSLRTLALALQAGSVRWAATPTGETPAWVPTLAHALTCWPYGPDAILVEALAVAIGEAERWVVPVLTRTDLGIPLARE